MNAPPSSEDPPDEPDGREGADSAPSDDELAGALDVVRRELEQPIHHARKLDEPGLATAIAAEQVISGPLPSAAEMAGYQAVDPALPGRIADGADSERSHRHEMETRQSKTEAAVSIVGVTGGLIFVILMVALAAYAVSESRDGLAAAAIIAALAPVAIALINRGRTAPPE